MADEFILGMNAKIYQGPTGTDLASLTEMSNVKDVTLNLEAGEADVTTRLGTDEMLLGEVLCAMLEGQFVTHKVTEDDVRNGFDGQTLLAAQKAFYEELIDFFRSRGRTDRAKAVAKQMAMIDAAVTAIETRIDGIDIDETIRGAMSGESPDRLA